LPSGPIAPAYPPNLAPCTAGCPAHVRCQCDAAGRIRYVQDEDDQHPRDRHWFDYDPAGHLIEARVDRDADGGYDQRSVLAHAAGCMIESRDDDMDGTIETTCRYDHACLVGTDACTPSSCAAAVTPSVGHPCTADCPAAAQCSCDDDDRIVELRYNDDADPAAERITTRSYRGGDRRVVEERTRTRGTVQRITYAYDAAGHMVLRQIDAGGPPVVDETRWTWGAEPDWLAYQQLLLGQVIDRRTRVYRDGKVLTERREVAGARPVTMRFFPDAEPAIVQPIAIESPLVTSARELACRRDQDCELIHDANCCSCSAGGSGIVVSRAAAPAVRRRIARACASVRACPAVISSDPSCLQATPACVEQLCTLRVPRYPGKR
jgi:YD repeat-containing protein